MFRFILNCFIFMLFSQAFNSQIAFLHLIFTGQIEERGLAIKMIYELNLTESRSGSNLADGHERKWKWKNTRGKRRSSDILLY